MSRLNGLPNHTFYVQVIRSRMRETEDRKNSLPLYRYISYNNNNNYYCLLRQKQKQKIKYIQYKVHVQYTIQNTIKSNIR